MKLGLQLGHLHEVIEAGIAGDYAGHTPESGHQEAARWLGRLDSNLEMAVSKTAFETTAELAELGIANRPRDFCPTKLLNLYSTFH